MAQDGPPNVFVCALHPIFKPSTMCVWSFVGCSLLMSEVQQVTDQRILPILKRSNWNHFWIGYTSHHGLCGLAIPLASLVCVSLELTQVFVRDCQSYEISTWVSFTRKRVHWQWYVFWRFCTFNHQIFLDSGPNMRKCLPPRIWYSATAKLKWHCCHTSTFCLKLFFVTVGDISTILDSFFLSLDQEPCNSCGEKLSVFLVLRWAGAATKSPSRSRIALRWELSENSSQTSVWPSKESHNTCRQIHLTRHFFSSTAHVFHDVKYTTLAQVSARARHVIFMVIHVVRLIVCSLCVLRLVPFRVSFLSLALLFPLLPVLCPEPLLPCGRRQGNYPLALSQMRSLAPWPNSHLSQVMSPSSSTTTTSQRPLKISSRSPPATPGPRTCMTRRSVTTPTAERSLHHSSLRSEKNQRAADKLITLLKKVCCQLSPFSHTQVQGDPYTNLVSAKNESQVAKWKTSEAGFSIKDQKERILSEVRTEIQEHEFHADSDRRSIQELNGTIESQRREIDHTLAGNEQLRRDQLLLQEQLSE